MLKPLLPCSTSTFVEQIDIHTPSSGSRLSSRHSSRNQSHSSLSSKGRLQPIFNAITLASINSQQQLKLHQQALQLLNSYSKWELTFCGIIGLSSKRNRMVCQLLEVPALTDSLVNGQASPPKTCLKIGQIPQALSSSRRLFFIEYHRGQSIDFNQKQLQSKLIQSMIAMSNSLILYTDSPYDLIEVKDLLDRSSRKMGIELRSQMWPEHAYVLNVQTGNNRISMISSMFKRTLPFNKHQLQSSLQKELMEDLACNIRPKSYKNMVINATVLCKTLSKFFSPEPPKQDIKSILSSIITDLYQQSLIYLTQLYDTIAKNSLRQEQPYTFDELLDIFLSTRTAVLQQYDLNLCEQMQQIYLQKLEDYMDQKERMILSVNSKKNKNRLKSQLQAIKIAKSDVLTTSGQQSLMETVRKKHEIYDHGAEDIIPNFLLKVAYLFEKGRHKLTKKDEKSDQSTFSHENQIMQKIGDRRYELQILEEQRQRQQYTNKIRDKEFSDLKFKRKQLKVDLNSLSKEIQLSKTTNQKIVTSKKEIRRKQDQLLGLVRDLQQKVRENDYVLRGVESQLDFDPSIDRMERKLSTLLKECEILEEKKSILTSHFLIGSNIQDITFNQK